MAEKRKKLSKFLITSLILQPGLIVATYVIESGSRGPGSQYDTLPTGALYVLALFAGLVSASRQKRFGLVGLQIALPLILVALTMMAPPPEVIQTSQVTIPLNP